MRAFIAVEVGLLKTTLAALLLPAFSLQLLANPSAINNVAANWNFNAGDEAFAAANSAGVEGPWTYDATIGAGGTGGWFANGSGGVGSPTSTLLTTPTVTIPESGAVTLNFDHRYSFEYDGTRYDGGNVRMSVNGAPFVLVENSRFTANGYPGVITGHNIITDQEGFSADSPGYATSAFIRSVAQLGDFRAGDTIAIQFAAGWDELALASSPSWVIDNVSILTVPAGPITVFPFGFGFEPAEGFLPGGLDAQNGWRVDSGQAEVWTQTVYSGVQAARIAPGGQISHGFATGCPIVSFSAYLQASPSSAPEIPLLAEAAVLYLDPTYGLTGLDGDGNGGGHWVGSGVAIPAGTWFLLTLKLDFDHKSWACAINGRSALADLRFHSDNVTAFVTLAAAASTGDTLLDDGRVTAESAPLPSELDPISMFPFALGFEPEEGYLLGDLDAQNGWMVDSGQAEVWNQTVYSGAQAARITPGGQISHEFAAGCPVVTVSAYLQASPSSVPEIPLLAQAAVLYLDSIRGLTCLDGDGVGGGSWVGSGVVIPARTWFQLTLKLDFERKSWECAVNGRPALSGLHFHSDSVLAFAQLAAAANGGDTLVDELRVNVEDKVPPSEISLLPAGFGFEPEEGYPLGNLDKRNGWRVEAGEAEVWSQRVYSGVQAARIRPGGEISHDFATGCPIVTFDAFLQATPTAAPEIPLTAQIAVLYLDAAQGITGLDGDGSGGGKWIGSGVTLPTDAWFRATLRLDFVSKTWSCAVNGKPTLSNLHFHANSISAFASFTASAAPKGATLLDQITFLAENGSFSLPTLTIILSGSGVEIAWPADLVGYRLQTTASLANPIWTDVLTSGNHLSDQVDQRSKFYRLIAP